MKKNQSDTPAPVEPEAELLEDLAEAPEEADLQAPDEGVLPPTVVETVKQDEELTGAALIEKRVKDAAAANAHVAGEVYLQR